MRRLSSLVVILAVLLSLVACSQIGRKVERLVAGPAGTGTLGCSLQQFHADLVAENGQVVAQAVGANWSGTNQLDWPGDWTTRQAADGQLEVVDVPTAIVRARSGTRVILLTDGAERNTPEFAVCDVSPG